MIIDTHCHLGNEDYGDIKQVIENFGKNIMIVSGVDTKTNKEVIDLINTYDNIYGSIGIHPEYASICNFKDLEFIERNLNNPKIVAIGEIGLDYHYPNHDKEKQKELFIKQIELAKKYSKPIIIHTRDSICDTYNIIKGNKAYKVPVTLHCFSESLEMAKEFIKFGCKLGIGGVVTFKNAKKLKEVVENIDIKNIVLETDSPYLSPEPYRGMKNEPKNVFLVAKKIAELKNMDVKDVIDITTQTSMKQYNIGDKHAV